MPAANDTLNWNCTWGVQKYDEEAVAYLTEKLGRTPIGADFEAAKVAPYEDNVIPENLLVSVGLTRISNLIVGTASTQALTAAATRIGVGNGVGSAVVGDTALSASAGSANQFFTVLDSTPGVSLGVMTFVATFTSANGNFAWNEFAVDVNTAVGSATSGATANTLINHKTSIAQGTKTAGQSWTASATITLA